MKLLLTPERLAEIEYDFDKADQAGYPIDWDTYNLVHDWRVLTARVQELEKVLEWYAGPAFSQTHTAAGLRQPYPILEDEGQKAREVLNKK